MIKKAYASTYVKRAELGKGNTYENLRRRQGGKEEGNCISVSEDLLTDQVDGRLDFSILWRGAGEGRDSEGSVGSQPSGVAAGLSSNGA